MATPCSPAALPDEGTEQVRRSGRVGRPLTIATAPSQLLMEIGQQGRAAPARRRPLPESPRSRPGCRRDRETTRFPVELRRCHPWRPAARCAHALTRRSRTARIARVTSTREVTQVAVAEPVTEAGIQRSIADLLPERLARIHRLRRPAKCRHRAGCGQSICARRRAHVATLRATARTCRRARWRKRGRAARPH